MTKFKKAAIGAVILVFIAALMTAFAFAYTPEETPAETGRIAGEAADPDQFRKERLEMKKVILAEKIAEGKITQEEADKIIAAIEACDGTGCMRIGRQAGAGFGCRNSSGNGSRRGIGPNGAGRGQGGCGFQK